MDRSSFAAKLLFFILAIPLPLSALSWIGTLISLGSFWSVDWSHPASAKSAVFALAAMLLAGTYPITYRIALRRTRIYDCLNWVSFLPLLHIVLFLCAFMAWSGMG